MTCLIGVATYFKGNWSLVGSKLDFEMVQKRKMWENGAIFRNKYLTNYWKDFFKLGVWNRKGIKYIIYTFGTNKPGSCTEVELSGSCK